jgi:hypothetical protein
LFGGVTHFHKYTRTGRQHFSWYLSGPRARGFLMTVYKFLSPRRQQKIREVGTWLLRPSPGT